MTMFWYLRIKQRRATIDDVPSTWIAGVIAMLEKEEEDEEPD